MKKPKPPSKTDYQRQLDEQPPLDDPRYQAYVKNGGKGWGYYYRITYKDSFEAAYAGVIRDWGAAQ